MAQNLLTCYQNEEAQFWKVESRFKPLGLFQYVYWNVDDGSTTTPADPHVHVIYVVKGSCRYDGFSVNPGDVLVCGLNKVPLTSMLQDFALFTIDMSFSFYYQMTQMMPSMFSGTAVKLESGNPFYELGRCLFELPIGYWVDTAESFMQQTIRYNDPWYNSQFHRVTQAAGLLAETWSQGTDLLRRDFAVSYRQLQRDFVSVMGLTPKEYSNMVRFTQAFTLLNYYGLTEAALKAGYWDQAHMIRDFKKMSGFTPAQVKKLNIYYVMNEIRGSLSVLGAYPNSLK